MSLCVQRGQATDSLYFSDQMVMLLFLINMKTWDKN